MLHAGLSSTKTAAWDTAIKWIAIPPSLERFWKHEFAYGKFACHASRQKRVLWLLPGE